jgi:hypothetical protein
MERRYPATRPATTSTSQPTDPKETTVTYDPVLTAIAASTNDALPEHLWRYHTAIDGPLGDLARALHTAAAEFTSATGLLNRTLQRLEHRCGRHQHTLTTHATLLRPHGLDTDALNLVQLLERHELHHGNLLATYQAWRRHQPAARDRRTRHLLPAPYDPTSGRLTLTATDDSTWLVTPDHTAASAYRTTSHAGRIIGEITATDHGWQPTAFTHPQHRQTNPRRIFQLPPVEDEPAACRSLLRWWAMRERPGGDSRTPDQLTTAERSALSA